MSYILDALRRADAERERGAVPDLNAQPLALTIAGDDEPSPRARVPWGWLGAGAALALAGVAAWQFTGSTPPPLQPAPAAMPAPMPTPAPAPVFVPPPPAPAVAVVPVPAPAIEPAKPAPAPKPAPPTPAAEPPLPKYARLPEDLKQQLPPLVVGGSVYSPRAASRMVILNGQVLHEGDAVAAGLTLEQIRPASAVLSLRGQRFELPF